MDTRHLVAVIGLFVLGGCAPWPIHFYVGDETQGRLSYTNCSFGDVVPEGLVVARGGIEVLTGIVPSRTDEVVDVRFDIPRGHVVRLVDRAVIVDPRDGSAPRTGVIDFIDPADRPSVDRWSEGPARVALQRPVDTAMVGRPDWPMRHYWIAARVGTGHADSLWLKLPDITVDGSRVTFPEIQFTQRFRVVLAPFNC